jgi:putative flippase GtrA
MRFTRFAAVAGGGFIIQIVTLAVLSASDWPVGWATAVAVECAALHNFWWHERWTWRDRRLGPRVTAVRLMKYHLTTTATAILGNVTITTGLVTLAGIPILAANAAAVGWMAAANYVVADRWVFAAESHPVRALTQTRFSRTVAVAALLAAPTVTEAAELTPATTAAWNAAIGRAENRLHSCQCEPGKFQGRALEVPGGTVHQWQGAVFVKGATLENVLHALTIPGTPPPQEDVLESRVLARDGDRLKVYLKLTRRAIVRVTYDTEHEVTFTRHAPGQATSRSVATRIDEIGGGDRGFLWKLNSYWRYTQLADGVRIELDSFSLSRRVPGLLKPAASPIINRVARESIVRTLDSVKRFLERPRN